MPMKNGQQWAVVAMMGIPEHTAEQADIREFGQPGRLTGAFVEDILGFDVKAELCRGINTFSDRWIKSMEAIEEEDLIGFKPDVPGGNATAFFETINRFLDGFAGQ